MKDMKSEALKGLIKASLGHQTCVLASVLTQWHAQVVASPVRKEDSGRLKAKAYPHNVRWPSAPHHAPAQ